MEDAEDNTEVVKVSLPAEHFSQQQKISPSIKEKLDKFENECDDPKRKAETSPELSKKEKKKLRNQEKNQHKQDLQESR